MRFSGGGPGAQCAGQTAKGRSIEKYGARVVTVVAIVVPLQLLPLQLQQQQLLLLLLLLLLLYYYYYHHYYYYYY